jgi:hypothetical protein
VTTFNGVPMVVARVDVPPAKTPRRLTVTKAVVLHGGGTEVDPPLGAQTPKTLGWWVEGEREWRSKDDNVVAEAADAPRSFWVGVSYQPDLVLRLHVEAEDLS